MPTTSVYPWMFFILIFIIIINIVIISILREFLISVLDTIEMSSLHETVQIMWFIIFWQCLPFCLCGLLLYKKILSSAHQTSLSVLLLLLVSISSLHEILFVNYFCWSCWKYITMYCKKIMKNDC